MRRVPVTPESIKETFWSRVQKTPTCWVHINKAKKFPNVLPYRRVYMGKPNGKVTYMSAHRYSWMINCGPIPDGLFVLHTCDNPACVRPDHLYLGTHADNMRDLVVRKRAWRGGGQHNAVKTHCPKGHEYTPENTMAVRGKPNWRRCRACNSLWNRQDRQNRLAS